MALKIRLSRGGAKKRPFYKIVVAEALSPRDGKFIERLGSYNPMVAKDHAERLVLDVERAKYPKNIGTIITPSKTNRYVAKTIDPRIEWQDELKKRMAYLRLGKRFSRGTH